MNPSVEGLWNTYLTGATGIAGATVKTFRTWGGSLAAFETARATEGPLSIRTMAEAAAARLANTPAISRTSYIHPAVLDLSTLPVDRRLAVHSNIAPVDAARLHEHERHMLAFLQAC